jgi:hypothetical protein
MHGHVLVLSIFRDETSGRKMAPKGAMFVWRRKWCLITQTV